tara:strand:+ start:138 stop:563 length:426 start_codon:yes stop_codon:yes gene_type:complete
MRNPFKLILLSLVIMNRTTEGFFNNNQLPVEPPKPPSQHIFERTPETVVAFDFDSIEYDLKRTVGKKIVLQISSLLPKVDTIGHDILHANNQFVVDVLANDGLSHELKKEMILLSIKLAQYGDDLGSFFLQQYYNIVHNII